MNYETRPGCYGYGQCIGILHLDFSAPFIPGDVSNASTYDYPVLYETISGSSSEGIMRGDPDLTGKVIAAAKKLAIQGVKGITGDSGFLIHYQDAITKELDIPVFLSSLLQIPLISIFHGNHQAIGILCADASILTLELLTSKGLICENKLIIGDMRDHPEFSTSIYNGAVTLDSSKIESEVVAQVLAMKRDNPSIGAFLLECSMLPPYASAAQEATGLPVYDYLTMINFFHQATHAPTYEGYY